MAAISTVERIRTVFAEIRERDETLNAFLELTEERALRRAHAVDAALRARDAPGPLAGMPFAVKSLFDVSGLSTLAGSKINADLAPATADARLIQRLEQAGAILVGTLNMDEYAYGFSAENAHYGTTRNPHDHTRVAGGSSSGSAAAVGAGLVPLTLGSDTNGSIRVPSAFCGVWGLKPTFGRLSRAGTFPFVSSLDHVGPIARSVHTLALSYDAMQACDPDDATCIARSVEPVSPQLEDDLHGISVARATGYFEDNADPGVVELVEQAAIALDATRKIEIPGAALARAAAVVITAAEAGELHLANLRTRAHDYGSLVVDRLRAATLVPAEWYVRARYVRAQCTAAVLRAFDTVDVILAPATPLVAQRIGQETMLLRGQELPARVSAGLLTQPLSCVGLPVICAPVGDLDGLPVGMQIVAPLWREDLCFRVARALERRGVARARIGSARAGSRAVQNSMQAKGEYE